MTKSLCSETRDRLGSRLSGRQPDTSSEVQVLRKFDVQYTPWSIINRLRRCMNCQRPHRDDATGGGDAIDGRGDLRQPLDLDVTQYTVLVTIG